MVQSDGVTSMGEKYKDQYKYQDQYNRDHYERIKVILPKDQHLKERIKTLADREGISVNQWLLRAIQERLEWYE